MDAFSNKRNPREAIAIVVMGPCACGKSTIGSALARRLQFEFADGDDFHPQTNIDKMAAGTPLDDSDRKPWYQTLNELLAARRKSETGIVLACSALKQRYRDWLRFDTLDITFVYLRNSESALQSRLDARAEHFMPTSLLKSQLADLEEPIDAIAVDCDRLEAEEIVNRIVDRLTENTR